MILLFVNVTPVYDPPPRLCSYDNKADIWSLGITALELAKGVAPYAHFTPMRILVLTIEDDPPSLRSYRDDKQRTGSPFSKVRSRPTP
jgi:serine/threonine protein kinase